MGNPPARLRPPMSQPRPPVWRVLPRAVQSRSSRALLPRAPLVRIVPPGAARLAIGERDRGTQRVEQADVLGLARKLTQAIEQHRGILISQCIDVVNSQAYESASH